jgi:hypothetical protein
MSSSSAPFQCPDIAILGAEIANDLDAVRSAWIRIIVAGFVIGPLSLAFGTLLGVIYVHGFQRRYDFGFDFNSLDEPIIAMVLVLLYLILAIFVIIFVPIIAVGLISAGIWLSFVSIRLIWDMPIEHHLCEKGFYLRCGDNTDIVLWDDIALVQEIRYYRSCFYFEDPLESSTWVPPGGVSLLVESECEYSVSCRDGCYRKLTDTFLISALREECTNRNIAWVTDKREMNQWRKLRSS